VLSDGPAPVVHTLRSAPGSSTSDGWSRGSRVEVWSTSATPAPIGTDWDPDKLRPMLTPLKNGTALKILEFPPDAPEVVEPGSAAVSPPMMHRTETVDYAIVLSGEIYLMLDDSEVLVRKGDVVIQHGNSHAWRNRSKQTCHIALLMIDGKYVRAHFQ
jgi:quercetin dioxygenase-like cupin family protein